MAAHPQAMPRFAIQMGLLAGLWATFACTWAGPAAQTTPAGGSSSGTTSDAGQPDAGPAVEAANYCELTAPFFCAYYLRCGRMAAATMEECLAIFDETCNARYEPRYRQLEAVGLLALDAQGIQACRQHLAQVPCAQQLRDLDGPCAALWVGTQPAGAPCGLDVESLVCAPQTACVLGLDLCGTCQPAAQAGQGCGGGITCQAGHACDNGTCAPRLLPGQSCADGGRCALGASCSQGLCQGPTYTTVGQPCDADRRCPYRSLCRGGVCELAPLQGELCTAPGTCASGYCAASSGICQAPHAVGGSCSAADQCGSARCQDSVCLPLPSQCLDRDGGA